MIGTYGMPNTVLFLLVLLGVAMLYGFVAGRDRVVHVLISLYIALAVVTNVPLLTYLHRWFQSIHSATLQLLWFLGAFLIIFAALWRSHILRGMARERGRWWESCLFSVLQVALIVTIVGLLMPMETVATTPPLIKNIFLSDLGRSVWLLAPFVALVALGRPQGGETVDLGV